MKAPERERRIGRDLVAHMCGKLFCLASRDSDRSRASQLFEDKIDEAVDLRKLSQDEALAHRICGLRADGMCRYRELDLRQACS